MEWLLISPALYLVIRFVVAIWNEDVEANYKAAQHRASVLLGEGNRRDAGKVMESANAAYKRSKIRKVLGFKL